jgi:predicted GTPase
MIDGLNQDDPTSEAETEAHEGDESKLPLQLAIVGRPNVGKSTLLNTLLQEQRVLVGPEAGLTRDSIRTQFQFDNRTVYLVIPFYEFNIIFFTFISCIGHIYMCLCCEL